VLSSSKLSHILRPDFVFVSRFAIAFHLSYPSLPALFHQSKNISGKLSAPYDYYYYYYYYLGKEARLQINQVSSGGDDSNFC
jgi:hypothetical protein